MSQTHDSDARGANRRITPRTPEQKAILNRRRRLTAVAAAALDEGRYAEAEAAARQSLSHGVGSGVAAEVLASALNAQGKSEEALQVYKTIADRGSRHPRILLPYALLLLRSGQSAEAAAAYNKQLPYLGFGDLLRAKGEFPRNVPQPRELETAIHVALGLVYSSSGSWGRHSQDDKALAHFQQALALASDSCLVNYCYGSALKRLGHPVEAQALLQKAAGLDHGNMRASVEKDMRNH